MSKITHLLRLPQMNDYALDDPRTTESRRAIIKNKGLLRRIYAEWYARICQKIPVTVSGQVLEIGSGGGFFKEVYPGCRTSEIFMISGVDVVLDARCMPLHDAALQALVMVDVFHHIPDAYAFLHEVQRVLRPGGRLIMIEPWRSPWSKCIYGNLHGEPFLPEAGARNATLRERWAFAASGPLSGANGALPWIVFHRDRDAFLREFPLLQIESIEPDYPFVYLASGGVSMRSLAPGWSFPLWRKAEQLCRPMMDLLAMFALLCISRK